MTKYSKCLYNPVINSVKMYWLFQNTPDFHNKGVIHHMTSDCKMLI